MRLRFRPLAEVDLNLNLDFISNLYSRVRPGRSSGPVFGVPLALFSVAPLASPRHPTFAVPHLWTDTAHRSKHAAERREHDA